MSTTQDSVREALAALKAARQFIVNGIEFGYIRMPDADTPDTAHDTLPTIEAAIAALSTPAPAEQPASAPAREWKAGNTVTIRPTRFEAFGPQDTPAAPAQPWEPEAASPVGVAELAETLRGLLSAQPTYSILYAEREEKAKALLARYDAAPTEPTQAREAGATVLTIPKEDIDYPADLFRALMNGNSPYAFYLFQWVPYQTEAKRWRLKMQHDVRAFDGREAFNIWPNGGSCGPFRDDEVEFIRISKSQFGDEWQDPRPDRASTSPKGST